MTLSPLPAQLFRVPVVGRRGGRATVAVECGIQRQQLRTETTDKGALTVGMMGPGGESGNPFSVVFLPATAAYRNSRRDHTVSEVQGLVHGGLR